MTKPIQLKEFRAATPRDDVSRLSDNRLHAIIARRGPAGIADHNDTHSMAQELLGYRAEARLTAQEFRRLNTIRMVTEATCRNFIITGLIPDAISFDRVTAILRADMRVRYGPSLGNAQICLGLYDMAQDPTRRMWLGDDDGLPIITGIRYNGKPS